MAAMTIRATDVFDFEAVPNPQVVKPCIHIPDTGECLTRYHPKVGSMKFRSLVMSRMHVMNLHWSSFNDVVMHDESPTDTVNINFHIAGRLDTKFAGLSYELNMAPGRHNLVFSPVGGEVNRVAAGDSLEMFHISLDRTFFSDIIGSHDRWSEKVQEDLLHNRAFSGRHGTLEITPQMYRLIGDVKQCTAHGAMRNLLVQSRVMELLALQIDQFRGPSRISAALPHSDADKLYQLKDYLDIHFLEDFTLDQLARICLLNEFKIKKGFKDLFGTTVFGHIRTLRMDYAERMLLDSSSSVEEVSEALGYEHAQHFSTAFKKYRGISPSVLKAGRNLAYTSK